MLERLETASNRDVGNIWCNLGAIVSDLCKVNLNLAVEVKKIVGVEWVPGQACTLHTGYFRKNQKGFECLSMLDWSRQAIPQRRKFCDEY